jgi:hypothetical protein
MGVVLPLTFVAAMPVGLENHAPSTTPTNVLLLTHASMVTVVHPIAFATVVGVSTEPPNSAQSSMLRAIRLPVTPNASYALQSHPSVPIVTLDSCWLVVNANRLKPSPKHPPLFATHRVQHAPALEQINARVVHPAPFILVADAWHAQLIWLAKLQRNNAWHAIQRARRVLDQHPLNVSNVRMDCTCSKPMNWQRASTNAQRDFTKTTWQLCAANVTWSVSCALDPMQTNVCLARNRPHCSTVRVLQPVQRTASSRRGKARMQGSFAHQSIRIVQNHFAMQTFAQNTIVVMMNVIMSATLLIATTIVVIV